MDTEVCSSCRWSWGRYWTCCKLDSYAAGSHTTHTIPIIYTAARLLLVRTVRRLLLLLT
jgi:hypothetical protein